MLYVLYFCLDSKGYYAILQVSENASFQEIKRAYRRLARQYHPDRNNSSFAEDMIKKINASFEVLSDKDKRVEYDRTGIKNERTTKVDSQNTEKNYTTTEQDQTSSFHNYNHERDSSKSSSDYKHSDNYTIRGTYKNNNPDRGVSVETQKAEIDAHKARFHIIIEPSLCMAFGGCETLAPKVFVVEKNKMINPKARIASENGANQETILAAAQTCPTKAIKIIDRYTGEQLFP
jgi:curved DNA-binding protein CbpA